MKSAIQCYLALLRNLGFQLRSVFQLKVLKALDWFPVSFPLVLEPVTLFGYMYRSLASKNNYQAIVIRL